MPCLRCRGVAWSLILLLALLPACQILSLPLQVLKVGFSALQWGVQNIGRVLPMAALLAMAPAEENEKASQAGEAAQGLRELLEAPPRRALAAILVPSAWLEDPELRRVLTTALQEAYPEAARVEVVPLRPDSPQEARPLRPGLPVLALAN